MKIIISVPNQTPTVPMAQFSINAFKELGHTVIKFNHEYDNLYERLLHKTNKKALIKRKNKQLKKLIDKEQPNLFLSIYGIPHTDVLIQSIKEKGIVTACWWLNDPFELAFVKTNAAKVYDFFFSNSQGTHSDYVKSSINHYFLPVGIEPTTHKKIADTEKKYDVLFVGDYHEFREKIMLDLLNNGINITIMGPWTRFVTPNSPLLPHILFEKKFTPTQMVQWFNEAKIVLNLHTWYNRFSYGVNPRLFEASACGAFQLCDTKDEIATFYKDKESIALYEKVEDLPELIHYYLTNDTLRNTISTNAFNESQNQTYLNRMKQLLQICGF